MARLGSVTVMTASVVLRARVVCGFLGQRVRVARRPIARVRAARSRVNDAVSIAVQVTASLEVRP